MPEQQYDWTKQVDIAGEKWTFAAGTGWYTLLDPDGTSTFPGDHMTTQEINDLLEEAGQARRHPD